MTTKQFTPDTESMLRDKLRAVRHGVRKEPSSLGSFRHKPLPAPDTIGVDGVNHINIYEGGATELGKALTHSIHIGFVHQVFGRFGSIETFWHYIRSVERDDRMRNMPHNKLLKFSEKLQTQRIPNFYALIMQANYDKINQTPEILNAMRDSSLPFDYYYMYKRKDGIRIRRTFAHWVVPGFEEIRKALKEKRQPDFTFLITEPTIDINEGAINPTKAFKELKPVEKNKKRV
jgi:hypothetical protein